MRTTDKPSPRQTKKATRYSSAKSRRPGKSRRIAVESLEKRELMTVGVNAIPAAVAPGSELDGVVQLSRSDGGTCTGTLLSTGRHVLTAAHCVDLDVDLDSDGQNDIGNGVIDPVGYTVTFEMVGRDIPFRGLTAADISLPSAWNGDWRQGNDIAILQLPALAPSGPASQNLGAKRFEINRASDEVGKSIEVVGYGATGVGIGTPFMLAGFSGGGTKRSGTNQFDSTTIGGKVLLFDLDNVPGEVVTAPGDSGGPSFIRGSSGQRLVAGVASYGTIQPVGSYGLGWAIGEQSGVTRVSQFSNWIDSVTSGRYNLVLDLSNQIVGNDGRSDTIKFRRAGPLQEKLEILVNGAVYHSDHLSRFSSVTVRGSGDSETITYSLPFDLDVTLDGRGGNDTLAGPNRTNRWHIQSTNSGTLNNRLRFSNVENLTGGSASDVFAFADQARVTGQIKGGGGANTLDYSSYRTRVHVDLSRNTGTGTGGVWDIRDVFGGRANDLLIGDDRSNILVGGSGSDVLRGMGGSDLLDGGDDEYYDQLFGGTGADLYVQHRFANGQWEDGFGELEAGDRWVVI